MDQEEMMAKAVELFNAAKTMTEEGLAAAYKAMSEGVKRLYRQLQREPFYVSENEIPNSRKEHLSPSGRYKLIVARFTTGPGTWDYSQGKVYKQGSDDPIAVINRNYGSFPFTWIETHKNGHSYLIGGEDYQGQTVIELDTGKRVDTKPGGFCWVDIHPNQDGTLLAVDGCYWAASYEVMMYDFSEPMQPPWQLLNGNGNYYEFNGWIDNVSCKIGHEEERIKLPDTAPEEHKKFNGMLYDDLTEEQADILDTYEDCYETKTVDDEVWTKP
jgi:hypothetical protein